MVYVFLDDEFVLRLGQRPDAILYTSSSGRGNARAAVDWQMIGDLTVRMGSDAGREMYSVGPSTNHGTRAYVSCTVGPEKKVRREGGSP